MEERRGDKIKSLGSRPFCQIMGDPGDGLSDSGRLGISGRPMYRCAGDVDSGDLPPLSGEPNSIASFATTEVEHGTARTNVQRLNDLSHRLIHAS